MHIQFHRSRFFNKRAPLAATITTESVFNEFLGNPQEIDRYFRDISTYGGCAGAAAAGVANLQVIDEDGLLENSEKVGAYLIKQLGSKLKSHKNVGEIRGAGLFAGVELVADRATKEPMHESKLAAIAADCMKNGVIIGRTNRSLPNLNNTLTLCPALTATKADIDEIVVAIKNAMDTVLG